jgi:thiol-disulfide isomerase/thioredoxin
MFKPRIALSVAALALVALALRAQAPAPPPPVRAPIPVVRIPRKSPEFTISMTGGKPPILLSSYKGKVIVLASILTTCPHCQHTVTLLTKLQEELGSRGLQVIACATQDAPELAVPLFVKQFNPPFPVGFNTDIKGVLDYYQYSLNKLPHMPMLAFIDRQFNIRAQHEGGDNAFFDEPQQESNLRGQIETLLIDSKATAPRK